jgi:hypothetical protein
MMRRDLALLPSFLPDDLSYVIRVDIDSEASALFFRARLDDYEFGPINHHADNFG